jgi:hypothetical protein
MEITEFFTSRQPRHRVWRDIDLQARTQQEHIYRILQEKGLTTSSPFAVARMRFLTFVTYCMEEMKFFT